MISNWIFVIVMILLAILAYFIGLTRGITGSQHLYDDGWLAAEEYFKQHPELVQDIDKMLDELYEEHVQREKQQKARRLVRELDELFQDSNENAPSGSQEAPETTQNEKMNGNTTEK